MLCRPGHSVIDEVLHAGRRCLYKVPTRHDSSRASARLAPVAALHDAEDAAAVVNTEGDAERAVVLLPGADAEASFEAALTSRRELLKFNFRFCINTLQEDL